MGCENCKNDCKEPVTVPLYTVEGKDYRREKTFRGTVVVFCAALLIITLIIGVCGIMVYRINNECLEKIDGINKYWIDFLSQYDIENYSYDYTQDGRGINIIGDNNGVTNNGTEADSTETDNAEEGR